jgi:hypothetical protein
MDRGYIPIVSKDRKGVLAWAETKTIKSVYTTTYWLGRDKPVIIYADRTRNFGGK